MRDFRINLIFEGSSEIMHLFIAREAVDTHLRRGRRPSSTRHAAGREGGGGRSRRALSTAAWYPARWFGWSRWPRYGEFGALAAHVRYVDRTARRLARALFHAMVRFGPKLEKRQSVLFRLVDIGRRAVRHGRHLRARADARRKDADGGARDAAAAGRPLLPPGPPPRRGLFDSLFDNDDVATYRVAQHVLAGKHGWLEEGVVDMSDTRQAP